MVNYGAISADDHLQEPVTLWQERLPSHLVDLGPRLVELPNGGHAFQIGNTPPKPLDVLVAAGQTIEQKRENKPARWENVRRGFWDAKSRLEDMDLDGIWASVMYPNMLLDVHMNQVEVAREVKLPMLQIYNDRMSEFCSVNPNRLIGFGLVPTETPEQAVAELRRVRKLDHVAGMLLPVKPDVSDWIDPLWNPLWAAADELGFVLSVHAGKPRWMATRAELAKQPHGMALYFHTGYLSIIEAMTNIFWSGCFERHPNLKVISVEGDIGWLAHWKERSDRVFSKFAIDKGFKTHPHEWFGRNFFATFEADPAGIRNLDLIGEDVLMWASDYPHSASSWPRSMEHIEHHFGHLEPRIQRKLTWDTCAHLYGIKPPSK